MTPTLLGRWQTRLLLMGTVGLLITLLFCAGFLGNPARPVYLWILIYLFLFGLGWDVLYMFLQKFRWDQDWPAALQWAAALWEGFFFILIRGILGIRLPLTEEYILNWFLIHYLCVWIAVFVCSQSVMRILYPRWRFHGGQWF